MRHTIILVAAMLLIGSAAHAEQTLSAPMEAAVAACTNLSKAIGATTTAMIKSANESLKATDIAGFADLRLANGEELSVDGHFVFDHEFVDSLLVNHKVPEFSSRYADAYRTRGNQRGLSGSVKLTNKALKAGATAEWKTVMRRTTEFAIVAEPGGLFTMTVRDADGNVLYAETENNKKGAAVRKAKIQLPDKATRVYVEVKNTGSRDASFALLGY